MQFLWQWPWTCANDLGSRSWLTNLCVKKEHSFFLYKKEKERTQIWTFPSSDLKISQMTFLHAVLMFSGLVSHTRADVSGGVWFVESWHILRSKAIYVWISNVPSFKRYGPDTIAQTDGQTYRKSDSYKPPPSNFVCEGYNHKLTNFGHIFNIL